LRLVSIFDFTIEDNQVGLVASERTQSHGPSP